MLTTIARKIIAKLAPSASLTSHNQLFAVKPYLQLGQSGDELSLVWFSSVKRKLWTAQYRSCASAAWVSIEIDADKGKDLKIAGYSVRRFSLTLPLFSSSIEQVVGSELPEYQILVDEEPVFASSYRVPDSTAESKVVVFGDFGDGKEGASATAAAVHERGPELILVAGDLVYDHGRISEYLNFFFPILNADAIHHDIGAPILRSVLTVAAAGNHDVGMPKQSDTLDDKVFSDLFGFFLFWQGTDNGPRLKKKTIKEMIGAKKKANQLLNDYGKSFLRKTNFSFNWKDQHWIILDANKYADWSFPELQNWLAQDLKGASSQQWKFVVFHQPGFNSDHKYLNEQRMRLICPILEAGKVDVVFNGHCHFYERHRPLCFHPECSKPLNDGTVPGNFVLDYQFDGITNTRPKGVLYIVTGASGKLVSTDTRPNADTLCHSTAVVVDTEHSFTELSFGKNHLVLRQLGINGNVLDMVRLDK